MSSVTASVPRSAVALVSLTGEREFRRVRAQGAVVRSALFTLRVTPYRPRYAQPWQPQAIVGIVISKKTLKHAVKRNRVRRRVREALRTLPNLPACRVTLHPTPAVLSVPFEQLQAELHAALTRGLSAPPKKAAPKQAAAKNQAAAKQSAGVGQQQAPKKPTEGR